MAFWRACGSLAAGGGGGGTFTTGGVYVTAFPRAPCEPSTWIVGPFTLEGPPLEVAPTMVSCFGPGRNVVVLIAGTWMTMVSGVLPLPGVQLTTPPFARVSVVTLPLASVRLTCPPVAPVGPAVPMKSAWMVIRRPAPLSPAFTYGRDTCNSSGRAGTAGSSQPVPDIGSTGVSSCVVRPGHASAGVFAVR